MGKIVALACLVMALACCVVGFSPWRSVMVYAHDAAPAMLMAGGLFTVAIAVLIRD